MRVESRRRSNAAKQTNEIRRLEKSGGPAQVGVEARSRQIGARRRLKKDQNRSFKKTGGWQGAETGGSGQERAGRIENVACEKNQDGGAFESLYEDESDYKNESDYEDESDCEDESDDKSRKDRKNDGRCKSREKACQDESAIGRQSNR